MITNDKALKGPKFLHFTAPVIFTGICDIRTTLKFIFSGWHPHHLAILQ